MNNRDTSKFTRQQAEKEIFIKWLVLALSWTRLIKGFIVLR